MLELKGYYHDQDSSGYIAYRFFRQVHMNTYDLPIIKIIIQYLLTELIILEPA